MRKLFPLISALLIGCASPASRVHVGLLDSTPRPPNNGPFEIFHAGDKPADKTFREIAAFTLDGSAKDEAEAIGAMAQRSRALGADGLIIQHTDKPFQNAFVPPIAWRAQGKRTFNATAFIYTTTNTPPTK